MVINWSIIATIASPVVALFIGAALNRLIERKPKLIAYFTHTSAFNVTGNNPVTVHTHGIVIKNIGKRPAADIRVRHHFLPQNFNVYPVVDHHVQNLPRGGVEIVFPALVPNEQVYLSYLYFPPVVYSQIHAGIRHSEGFAREVTALPTPQFSSWILNSLRILLIIGSITSFYLLFEAVCWIVKIVRCSTNC